VASQPTPADLQQEYPSEFLNFLQSEALAAVDTTLNDARATAIKAYNGEPYGDEEDGRSKAVTRDVSEVIDFMLTGVLSVVNGNNKTVEFQTEPEDVPTGQIGQDGQPITVKVDYGEQITLAVRDAFFRKQKGYRILHDLAKAGMLEKTGIVKTFAEPRAPLRQQQVAPRAAIQGQGQDFTLGGLKVVDAQPLPEEQQPPLPPPVQVIDGATGEIALHQPQRHPAEVLHAVTVDVPQPPIVRDEAIPNEWFLVSADTVELDDAPYVGECTPKSISQLVAMGYDYATLKELWDSAPADTVVDYARDSQRGQSARTLGRREGAQRRLWFYEEYPLYDLNGDGIAERLFVHRIGRNILKVMPVDEQPYSGWSPIPMQHRFTGQSVADKTQDIQRIRSVLLRQGLDSLYLSNAPRMTVPMDGVTEDTFDDLLTVTPGGLIRYKGNQAPTPLTMVDTSATAFNGMEMMSAERESRTGVTRQSQGLNPDTMNETASGMAMLQANSDQFELYVVRNLVEQAVAPMNAKRYRLMKAHTPPFRMRIDGRYQQIDPSKWPDEIDVQINVGLGTGTKQERVAALSQLMSTQAEAKMNGIAWVTDENMYNAAKVWIEDAGLGSPSQFVTDPSTLPQHQPQGDKPDPAAIEAQGKAQLAQQESAQAHQQAMGKLQLQQQQQQAEATLRAQANDADLAAKRESAALDIQLKRERAAAEAQLAVRQQDFEESLAVRRQQFNEDQARKDRKEAAQDDGISDLRPGGELDQ
jgi:hypothetical protein